MGNRTESFSIYRPSSIRNILKSARERAVNPNMRTKKELSAVLGITYNRLSGMEDGTSQIPMELAYEWCMALEDETSWRMILHTYGASLPPTDPRLTTIPDRQFNNFKKQVKEALEAIEALTEICRDIRPGKKLDEKQMNVVVEHAQQVFDMKQATDCVLDSLKENLGLHIEDVIRRWTQKALVDGVVLQSIKQYDEIKREVLSHEIK